MKTGSKWKVWYTVQLFLCLILFWFAKFLQVLQLFASNKGPDLPMIVRMLFSWSPSSQCWSSFSRINCPTILSGDSLALCVTMSRCHEVGLSEMCEMWLTDCSSCYSSAGVGKRMLWLAKLGCKWCSSVLHSFASNSHLAPARDCFVTACSSLGRHGTSQIWSTGDQPAATSCQILNSQTAAQRRVSDERLGDCKHVCLDQTELWGANLRQEWQNNNYHSQGWLSTTDGAIFLSMFSPFFCMGRQDKSSSEAG